MCSNTEAASLNELCSEALPAQTDSIMFKCFFIHFMKRAALPLLFSVMSLYAGNKVAYDITLNTRAAINALRVGASEADVLALLRPVSLDSGRVTWGGTGRWIPRTARSDSYAERQCE
jgi:hypothetical protein